MGIKRDELLLVYANREAYEDAVIAKQLCYPMDIVIKIAKEGNPIRRGNIMASARHEMSREEQNEASKKASKKVSKRV